MSRVLLTNRVWIPKNRVPQSLLDDFYYETTEKAQDEFGLWYDAVVPIDMIVDRREMREKIASLLAMLTGKPAPVA